MTTNTSSISSVTLNDITVSAIVNEVIKDSDLAEIEKNKTKADTVASPADVKKGTYAMVNVKLMDYFVDAYRRVSSLNNKTAWAEREVITATMESDYYKKAFGSDDAYAKEIGKSASALSKIKNSIKVRDELERISGFSGYSTSFVDELISPFNKTKDAFALFVRYSGIDLNTTVKEVRAMYKHYQDVIIGKARPNKKGFFKHKEIIDGVETMVDDETEDEYQARIKAENEAKLQASNENQQASNENQQNENQQNENQQASNENQQNENQQNENQQVTNEIKSLANKFCDNTNKMTVNVYGKKRNSKMVELQIDNDTMLEIFEILVAKGIVTA